MSAAADPWNRKALAVLAQIGMEGISWESSLARSYVSQP